MTLLDSFCSFLQMVLLFQLFINVELYNICIEIFRSFLMRKLFIRFVVVTSQIYSTFHHLHVFPTVSSTSKLALSSSKTPFLIQLFVRKSSMRNVYYVKLIAVQIEKKCLHERLQINYFAYWNIVELRPISLLFNCSFIK